MGRDKQETQRRVTWEGVGGLMIWLRSKRVVGKLCSKYIIYVWKNKKSKKMVVEFSPRMITCQCKILLDLLWYDFQNVWRVSWRSHWVTSPALAPGVVCWEPRFSHKELRTSGSPHHAEPCGDNSLLSAGEHKTRGVLKGAGGRHRGRPQRKPGHYCRQQPCPVSQRCCWRRLN